MSVDTSNDVDADTNSDEGEKKEPIREKKKISLSIGKKITTSIKRWIIGFRLTPEFIARMRWILYLLALLTLYLAFRLGDDWYVREFANYDWARQIGY